MPTNFETNDNQDWQRRLNDETELRVEADFADEALWDLFNVYADGEATPEEAAQVEAMLHANPAYVRELDFIRVTAESARSFLEVEPPRALREVIFAATSHRPTLAKRVAARWNVMRHALVSDFARFALPVGAVVAAGLAAIVFWPRHGEPIQGPGSTHPTKNEVANAAKTAPGLTGPDFAKSNIKPVVHPANSNGTSKQKVTPKHQAEPDIFSSHNAVAQRSDEGAGIRVKSASVKNGPDLNHTKPKLPTRNMVAENSDTPRLTPAAYSVLPKMDDRNQRLAWLEKNGGSAPMPDVPDTMPKVEVAVESTTSPTTTATNPDNGNTIGGSGGKATVRRVGHLLRDQLPPDPRLTMTNADFKRERDAETQGYDRETIQSIQRRQATVSLVGRF